MVSFLQKIALATILLLSASVSTQAQRVLHGNCLPDVGQNSLAAATHNAPAQPNRLSLMTQWDAERVYPVAVILVSFSDLDFLEDSTPERYDRIFNEKGYNEGVGPGCVADYFRTQSGGLFNPRFDIYGPVKVSNAGHSSTGKSNYGANSFNEATKILVDSIDINASQYDWNGDGRAEAFVYIYAGYGGNEDSDVSSGCIWPNTGSFWPYINTNDISIGAYSASAERWSSDRLCGIGTICHEFSHTLGLPDIYPTDSDVGFSVCDEWDLMDGGNFTNNGWCPCNYSALEKILLGWADPIELTHKSQVFDLPSIADGGAFYRISTENDNEYYLLENRQWNGWDLRTPGHGLLVSHVDYQANRWAANTVNNLTGHPCYSFIHADGLDYDAWDAIIGNKNPYVSGHSRILSTTPYPYVTEDDENRVLTDTSTPAATTYSGTGLLGKPITNIQEDEDGLVSFVFMDATSGIADVGREAERNNRYNDGCFDLQGRPVSKPAKELYIRNGRKVFY